VGTWLVRRVPEICIVRTEDAVNRRVRFDCGGHAHRTEGLDHAKGVDDYV
jgi:hypothetical protein